MTRVELQNASDNQYELLHEQMAKQGFIRTVTGDDGKVFNLPRAEYRYISELPLSTINAKAITAISLSGANGRCITVEYNSSAWYNLEPKQKP